jgi:hypothetical protein
MNESIYFDLSSVSFNASASCRVNGGMSDRCLYEKLCPVINSHFTNYIIYLMCALGIIFIVMMILNHTYYKNKPLLYFKRLSEVFFFYISAVVMYFIVFLYFNL